MKKILYFIFIILLTTGCGKGNNSSNSDGDITLCGLPDNSPPSSFSILNDDEPDAPFVDYDRDFKDLGTDFVVNKFFQTPETLFNFMTVVYGSIDKALQGYRAANNLEDKAVFVLFKGGNVLRIIANNYFELLPPDYRNFLMTNYAQYFKRSDADFSVYVDPAKVSNYEKTFDEITLLVFNELDSIRKIFLNNPETYFDFFRFSTSYADSILTSYYDTLSSLSAVKDASNTSWYGAQFSQLELPNAEATSNNSSCDYKGQFDYRFVEVTSTPPAIDATRLNNQRNWIFNTDNRTLQWHWGSDPTQLVKFSLVRSKVAFEYTYQQNSQLKNKDVGGELIDVSLPNQADSRLKHFLSGYSEFVHSYQLTSSNSGNTLAMNAYSLKYLAEDLEFIIFGSYDRPWNGGAKYGKRLYRLFFLYLMDLINNLNPTAASVYLQQSISLVNQINNSLPLTKISPNFSGQVQALQQTQPTLLMSEFWGYFPTLIGTMINNPEENDTTGFKDMLNTILKNLNNGVTLTSGTLKGSPQIDVNSLYLATSDQLF